MMSKLTSFFSLLLASCFCLIAQSQESEPNKRQAVQEKDSLEYQVVNQRLVQGGFLIGKTQPGVTVKFLKHQVKINQDGYFFIGFGRDFPNQAALTLQKDGREQTQSISIASREWKIERIDGLPPGKVTPRKPEVIKRIRQESALIRKARGKFYPVLAFKEPFIKPAEGRISGVYGSQRVLNGVPKRPHFGLDIAAVVGTPVNAPAAGKVTLVHKDMFYSGGTIIIDHGYGVTSTFLHLSAVDIQYGQEVTVGQTIGKIGATGRASGPHLDWRINWFEQRLDPALFIDRKKRQSYE